MARLARKKSPPRQLSVKEVVWKMRLYVANDGPRCLRAFVNLKRICEERLPGIYDVEVIDLVKNPALSRSEWIMAIPTLVQVSPLPGRRLIGDLSDTERVITHLGLPMERARRE